MGDMERAKELFSEITGKGLNLDVHTHTILIDGLCKIGNVEAA